VLLLTRLLISRAPQIRMVLSNERGQGMVEYALILFLISIGAVLFLTAIGFDIQEVFDEVENALGIDDGEVPAAEGDDDNPAPGAPAP
jgi:pilus assembly protein Flp/PilA